jgi:hypothetical protein
MATMIAPSPYFSEEVGGGTTYTADAQGVITSVAANDIKDLRAAGCEQVGVGGHAGVLIGRLLGANMNSTADQAISLFVDPGVPFRVTKVTAKKASISLTTAQGTLYTAASKGGTAYGVSTDPFSAMTGSTVARDVPITGVSNTVQSAGATIFLALTTAQGAAATADFYVYGDLYI